MDIDLLQEVIVQAQPLGPRPNERQCRLGRLLHDIAQLPGQDQLALAVHLGGLDEQDVPAHGGPGQARCHARFGGPLGDLGHVFRRAEELGDALHGDLLQLARLAFGDQHGDGPDDVRHLAFEVPDACLTGVGVDDLGHGSLVEHHPLFGQAVLFQLLRDEELARDVHLLFPRVAR